jgi:hypothetical protein
MPFSREFAVACVLTVVALFVASEARAHSLPVRKPWRRMSLLERERYLRLQVWHAKGALRWARRHRGHGVRELASVYLIVPAHVTLVRRATVSLHRLQDALVRTASSDTRYRVARRVVCSFDWSPSSCSDAMRVSWCESRWSTWAVSGQFAGWFQLGTGERLRYGVGSYRNTNSSIAVHAGIWSQVRAAHDYYIRSGRDWSPWQCRPTGLAW